MAFDINDTITQLEVIKKVQPPTTTLVDIFFKDVKSFTTKFIQTEIKEAGQPIAPFVVRGGKGVNIARKGSKLYTYEPPMTKPKRTIDVDLIEQRGLGENVYSDKTPQQRAMEIRSEDLAELTDSCIRREEWMAAQMLLGAGYTCRGFADDGVTEVVDEFSYKDDFKNIIKETNHWDNPDAKIMDSISDLSRTIRNKACAIPTVAICSYNVGKYLMNNKQLKEYLAIPNTANLKVASMQPRIIRPDLLYLGKIDSLNLEIYSYDSFYQDIDDNDKVKPFIPDDNFIIGVPNLGRRSYGAVTQVVPGTNAFKTYVGQYVPKYTVDDKSDVAELSVASKCLVLPKTLDTWGVIKCKGQA